MQIEKLKMSFRRNLRFRNLILNKLKDFSPTKVGFEMTNGKLNFLFSFFLMTFLFTSVSFSQWEYELFPSGLNIQPFTANILEPKTGFLIALDKNQLQLDISTSKDIVHWSNDKDEISFGADLFTFTRLRSTDDFKFPVETIDYLFGFNAGYKTKICNNNEYGFRFRLSHISAHLVDGQFDAQTQQWRDGRKPFVFSKEFIELFPFYRVNTFRAYAGFTYIFHVIPDVIKNGIFQIGFDYFATQISTDYLTPFVAYDFKLNGVEKYAGNNIISAGVKFGNWNQRGLSLYFTYMSGKSIHGEYFDVNENYSSVGFNFEL